MISLNVNGKNYRVDVSDDTPLLWVIRDYLSLRARSSVAASGNAGHVRFISMAKRNGHAPFLLSRRRGRRSLPLRDFLKIIRSRGHGSKNKWFSAVIASRA